MSVASKVLFLKEKYYGGNPQLGLTDNNALMVEPLRETGFVSDITIFYFDEFSLQLGQPMMGEVLLEMCAKDRPDLVIFIMLGVLGLDPPRRIMSTIMNVLGTKVYVQRHDSVGTVGHKFTQSWFPFVNFICFVDATLSHLGYKHQPKAIQGFTNVSAKHFYNRGLERDIDVSFLGPAGSLPRRAEYIEFLKGNGVNVLVRGGRGNFLPVEEYSRLMGRSKISLSFTLNGDGYAQMKGRTLEIMRCKTMVIEDEGIETKGFFDEGRDFVMARSKEDMLEKVLYYLKHDDEREQIAGSGHGKVTTLYTTRNYWGYVLSKIGFELPDSLLADRHFQELSAKLESL